MLEGKAQAAIVPTPMVGGFPDLITIITTEQVPHTAISSAPNVPADVRAAVRKALIEADKTPEGQAMLAKINFPAFEATNAKVYEGFAGLLEGVWGY